MILPYHSFLGVIQPEESVQVELLINIRVMVSIEFAHISALRPSWVVNFAPSDFNLIIAFPSLELSISEDSPSTSKVVSVFQISIDSNIFITTESVSIKFYISNLLAETIRPSCSNKMELVLTIFTFDLMLGMMNVVIIEAIVLNCFSVPGDSEGVTALGNSVS